MCLWMLPPSIQRYPSCSPASLPRPSKCYTKMKNRDDMCLIHPSTPKPMMPLRLARNNGMLPYVIISWRLVPSANIAISLQCLGILPKATSRSVTMVPPQSLFRSPQRMILQIRSLSANRSLSQRRFAHIEGPQLTGAADNAFNRERQAVKAHAAATSGEILE